MKLPISWLADYVDIKDVNIRELAEKLVHIGFEVEEIIDAGKDICGVTVGKILSVCPHENADKLVVCKLDTDKKAPLQIVTGAKNIAVGDLVPVATDGAQLPNGKTIVKGQLRGVLSEGMLCSGGELGVDNSVIVGAEVDGILILPQDAKIGTDIKTVLGIDEIVLDISVTANRPDCQSVYGIAREIAAMLNKPLKPLNLSYQTIKGTRAPMGVSVRNPLVCSRYTGRIIEHVKIAESPAYIKKRLRLSGLKPHNNVVDITNYVLLEVGQPLHAFDIRTIEGSVVVRNANKGEKIKLLDGQEYTLSDNMLVIADEKKPLALAGVMGGEHSGIADDTQTVFLEAARFARGSVRQTSRAFGLKSDSSARYEKGVDYASIDTGRERALALFYELGAGKIVETGTDVSVPVPEKKMIETSEKQISSLLGITIPEKEIIRILSALDIQTTKKNGKLFCLIPLFREDIEDYPDLAEEVIRFYGYGNIPSTMFCAGETAVGGYSERDQKIRAIKSLMTGSGAFEVITYSFISPKQYDKLNVPKNNPLRNTIEILNPLSEDYSMMRTQLSGGILNAVKLNLSRKNEAFRLFEVSRTFQAKSLPLTTELPSENETLCAAFVGKDETFYTLKSAVAELLETFRLDYTLEYSDCVWLHPGVSATIRNRKNGEVIGFFGKLHPQVAKNYELSNEVFLAEICLESLLTGTMPNITYKNLPKYPHVDRDLALVVKEECLVGELIDCIKAASKGLCERVGLFDIYRGAQIETGHKSIAFSIRLRCAEHTLSDAEIQSVMQTITDALDKRFGAKLRS